jgi:hypothetical protein
MEVAKLSTCNDPSKQKCSGCFRWRDKTDFNGDFITCASVCRKNNQKGWQKLIEKRAQFNSKNTQKKMCLRCLKIADKKDFITEVNKVDGECCSQCRDDIFNYRDNIADVYLQLKIDAGPCVDCGEDDIRLLEFDHVDREKKKINLSGAGSIRQLQEEYMEVVNRCGMCHRRRTKTQLNYGNKSTPQKQFVDQEKRKRGCCNKCGIFDDALLEAFEFDHIDPSTKSFNISTMVSNNADIKDIKKELPLCQLLCVHCHKLKTIEDNGYYLYIQYETGLSRNEIRSNRVNNLPLNTRTQLL